MITIICKKSYWLKRLFALGGLVLLLNTFSVAAEITDPLKRQDIKSALSKFIPQQAKIEIKDSPIANFYEISVGSSIVYLSHDYKLVMQGTLIDVLTGENFTQKSINIINTRLLKEVVPKDMIVFKATDEKHRVKVFTDVDCGFCRKLHREMASYQKAGITIEYLAFPRAGVPSVTYNKMQNIWCAQDQHTAITRGKRGQSNPTLKCTNPVQDQYALGRKLGVRGTPSMITENGVLLTGYMPAEKLASILKN